MPWAWACMTPRRAAESGSTEEFNQDRANMKILLKIGPVFLLLIFVAETLAQQWVNPHFECHRLDMRDLGYPGQTLIPGDDARISALMTHANNHVYGATSGKHNAYLFFFNRYINKVRPLGKIANEKGVYHTLAEGPEGKIYIGTGRSMFEPFRFTQDFPVGFEAITKQLWDDVKEPYKDYAGGHIFLYDPKTGDKKVYMPTDQAVLEDLGIPVAHNGIYAMRFNARRSMLYGITYPDAHFFTLNVAKNTIVDYGEMLERRVYNGPERHWRSIPRDLYIDPNSDDVFTSGEQGIIVRFPKGSDKWELMNARLPGEYWEGLKSIDYPVIEAIDVDRRGRIFAGTNDGHVIQLDLENDRVIVLGKPRVQRRMRAMKVGLDDKLYMITGEMDRFCKLHTYDLTGQTGFAELGPFSVDRSPYYAWRAYQFDAMTIGTDGTVFCGESDRGGHLFLYLPSVTGQGPFPQVLNPTNAVVERMREDTPALIPEKL